jgi:hypothetical protein
MPVTIGANTYNVIGAAFDAPGSGGVTTTLGTITLSSGIIGTDGASGNSVVQQARTIWLADGQQLCFSSGGDSYLHAIGNALFINATNFVEVSNGLQVGGGLSTGGNIQSLGSMQIGSTTAPASSALEFHSSGHTTADVTLTTSGGSSTANSGTLTIAAAYTAFSPLPTNAANDGAAATAGVPVGGVYRNGSALQIRVA